MIVSEHRLRDIISEIPDIDLNANNLAVKTKFGWGDKHELNRYLAVKGQDSYPLIWLLPSDDRFSENGLVCQKDCSFIIATLETNTNLFNDQRYERSYDLILNPLTSYLIEGLDGSNISYLDDEYSLSKKPNYSESKYSKSGETENASIDLWDATAFNCKVEFNNETLKPIIWKK